MDASERSERLRRAYSARDTRELASTYDEWAQDYEDDMLSLGYAIPAVAAGFVGRHVPLDGRVLDAGAGTGVFGNVLRVLGYADLVGIDISERMLEKAGEKGVYRALHRMVLGEPLGFDDGSFSAAFCVGVFTTNHAPPEALDELVRVVEPGGWVIFSVRDDVYRSEGFEEKQASLEDEGGVAEGDDERGVPALPRRERLAHDPPLRLRGAVAFPVRRPRTPAMHRGSGGLPRKPARSDHTPPGRAAAVPPLGSSALQPV